MFKPKIDNCVTCLNKRLIVVKKGYCKACNAIAKGKKVKKIKYNKKVTGEKDMFMEIWGERPHYSEVSGQWLGNEAQSWFFAHILPKKNFPNFRLEKSNVMLMTQDEHYAFDMTLKSKLKQNEMWDHVFRKAEELRNKYNELYR